MDADQIIVMDHGKIVERGTHRELLARDGTYAHLWNLQLQEQEEEEQRLRVVGSGLTSYNLTSCTLANLKRTGNLSECSNLLGALRSLEQALFIHAQDGIWIFFYFSFYANWRLSCSETGTLVLRITRWG